MSYKNTIITENVGGRRGVGILKIKSKDTSSQVYPLIWYNVGPPSTTLAQQYTNTCSVFSVLQLLGDQYVSGYGKVETTIITKYLVELINFNNDDNNNNTIRGL